MGVAVRGRPRKKRLDRFYIYSEYLMHYILKLGEMVFVDQNPELMNPSVRFP